MIAKKGIGRNRHLEVTSKDRVARRRRKRRRIFILLGILIALLIGGAIGVLHLKAIRIQTVTVAGGSDTMTGKIKEAVNRDLSGSYYFLIPKNSTLLYPKKVIESHLAASFPGLSRVSVQLAGPSELKIAVTERKSIGTWCDTTGGSACYFIDADGVLYENAPQITGNVYFTYMGALDTGTSSAPLRGTFLPADQFKKLNTFLKNLEDHKLFTPVAFSKTEGDEGTITTREGIQLFIKLMSDFDAVEVNLASALNASSLKDPATRAKLEYIDLRFGSKLYYKLRGGVAPHIEEE